MSLRAFHIVLISSSLGLLGLLGVWSFRLAMSGASGPYWGLALCGAAGLAAGLPYLAWFVSREHAAHS